MASTGFNSGLDIGKSYYVATANPAPDHPALVGDVEADLVVVGGGCTGLSAAFHAAERGLKVVLLERGKVGWGASGRNGGQMIPFLGTSATIDGASLRSSAPLKRCHASVNQNCRTPPGNAMSL